MPPKKRSNPASGGKGGGSQVDPSKLKVSELKAELENRGLDTEGKKAELVKRLEDALKAESGEKKNNYTLKLSSPASKSHDRYHTQSFIRVVLLKPHLPHAPPPHYLLQLPPARRSRQKMLRLRVQLPLEVQTTPR